MAKSDCGEGASGNVRGIIRGQQGQRLMLVVQDGSAAAVAGRQRGRQPQRLRWRRSKPASVETAEAGAVVAGVATCGSVRGGLGGPVGRQ